MRQHFQSVWQSANLCYVMLYYYFSCCGSYGYLKISEKHWPLESVTNTVPKKSHIRARYFALSFLGLMDNPHSLFPLIKNT